MFLEIKLSIVNSQVHCFICKLRFFSKQLPCLTTCFPKHWYCITNRHKYFARVVRKAQYHLRTALSYSHVVSGISLSFLGLWNLLLASENFWREAMGSDPGVRMKTRGELQLLSTKLFSRSNVGGSTYSFPNFLITKFITADVIWKALIQFIPRLIKNTTQCSPRGNYEI